MTATPDESMSLSLSTGAKLAVPEGAVGAAVEIAMQRPSDTQSSDFVKALPSTVQLASAPYVLTPHGFQFEHPVELTLPIESEKHGQLVVVYLEDENDKTWEAAGVPEISGGSAKLQVDHFSVWMLVELKGECVVDADDDLDEALDEGSCGSTGDPNGDSEGSDGPAPGGVKTSSGGAAPDDKPSSEQPRVGAAGGAGGAGAEAGAAGSSPESGAAGDGSGGGEKMSMTPTVDASNCGNGILDEGQELCDTAIAAGKPGACPTDEFCKSMDALRVCPVVPGAISTACLAVCASASKEPPIDGVEWQECKSVSN